MPAHRRAYSGQPHGRTGFALAPGMRVCDAGYLLKRLLGRGGLCEVWLAWDRKIEQDVALKILPPTLLHEPPLLESIKSVTVRAAALIHPAIAAVRGFVRDHETAAIVSEYVNGWSVAALKVDRPQKRYRVNEITPWVRQVCDALEHAHHEVCLVHRDLKPENLLLDPRDHPKLTDFAVAHAIRSALAQQGHLVYGSIAYLSPQQIKGAEASVLDDVYSLGATIYDLLTGTPPFYSGDILAQVHELPPPTMTERLSELQIEDSIPLEWEQTVAACLVKDPAQRPQSALEVFQRLETKALPASGEAEPGRTKIDRPIPAQNDAQPADNSARSARSEVTEPLALQSTLASPEMDQAAVTAAEPVPFAQESATETAAPEVDAVGSDAQVSEPARTNAVLLLWAKWPRRRKAAALLSVVGLAALVWIALSLNSNGSRSRPARSPMTGPPGSLDTNFNAGPGADQDIRSLAIQSDGKILVGGRFTNFAGASIRGLARLRSDGTAETNFAGQTSGTVHAIALQPDGKILVGGDFVRMNGEARRRVARLNPDGTLDSSFDAKGALNREVRALLIQRDGKILVSGSFDGSSGNRHNRITRLNPDGTRDGTFAPGAGANAAVWALALQPDGAILAGGEFSRFDNATHERLVRLLPDGSVDPTFKCDRAANATVLAIWVLPEGKILLAGNFTRSAGRESKYLARLSSDGTIDASFRPDSIAAGGIRRIVVAREGKLLIGGPFESVGNAMRNGVARLNADGTLDRTFDPGQGATEGTVWRLEMDGDGKVVVAGGFKKFNGSSCGRIVRLNGEWNNGKLE